EFNIAREKEGEELCDFFRKCLRKLRDLTDRASGKTDEQKEIIRKRIRERAEEYLKEPLDGRRFEEELLYYIEKMDITEEITRLQSHFSLFDKELEKSGNGKKIDFILQEINRETNTIASKSQHPDIIECTINMKDLISQLREQAANIE
ncbi:MAG: endoribonuclease YicC domain-containing protein, partial [Candidatus Muiribacteriaceae bacterium]